MITERLRCVADNNSGRLAVIDGNERITSGELLRRIDAARAWPHRALHVQNGDVVFATVETSWQFVACLFAVAELGGIFVPCHPGSHAPELRALAERVGVQGVITDRESRSEWDAVLSMDRVLGVPEQFEETRSGAISRHPAPEAAALYMTTSGSTGLPRIVPRSHGNLIAGA